MDVTDAVTPFFADNARIVYVSSMVGEVANFRGSSFVTAISSANTLDDIRSIEFMDPARPPAMYAPPYSLSKLMINRVV